MKKLFLLLAMIVIATMQLTAQDSLQLNESLNKDNYDILAQLETKRLQKQLALDEKQTRELLVLNIESYKKLSELERELKKERAALLKKIIDKRESEFKKIFSKEQYERYSEEMELKRRNTVKRLQNHQ